MKVTDIRKLDAAVDEFAKAMKARLRAKARQGYVGWERCGKEALGPRMLSHAAVGAVKGTPTALVDAANLAMMIHRDERGRARK